MTMNIPKEEKRILVIRKHWFNLFKSLFPLIIFSVFITWGILQFGKFIFLVKYLVTIKIFLIASIQLVLLSYSFIIWTNWYLDIWIITEKRILDIQQISLFSRNVSEVRLDHVQDITVEVKGIIATFLSFGRLQVQSAGEAREFYIKDVRLPYNARDTISKKIDEIHTKKLYNLGL